MPRPRGKAKQPFAGKKIRALSGTPSKTERQKYWSRAGQIRGKKPKPVFSNKVLIESHLKKIFDYQKRVEKLVLDAKEGEKSDEKTIKLLEQETIGREKALGGFIEELYGRGSLSVERLFFMFWEHRARGLMLDASRALQLARKGRLFTEREDILRGIKSHGLTGKIIKRGMRHPLGLERVKLRNILDGAVKSALGVNSKKWKVTVKGNPQQVRLPRGFVEEMLIEVVRNASFHTPEGGSIVVEGMVTGNKILFSVEDNGKGISKADKAKLMKENGFTTRKGGTGIGLKLVRKGTAFLKGKLRIKSAEGKGTKVTIELPHLIRI